MGYLDRIDECNNHDLGRYAPFAAAEQRIGWIRLDRIQLLEQLMAGLQVSDQGVTMSRDLSSFEARSEAVAEVVTALMERGEISAWRGELYPVGISFDAPPLLELERSAVPFFGARAYGVHVNGFTRRDGDLLMWVAHRARDKPTYPGMLDNMVAGGQPIGISLHENVIKEAAEEASIPRELAAGAVPTGSVSYCHENEHGLKPDCMFCYDLELPPDFEPRSADGEVEAFELVPVQDVAAIVRDTSKFKFNCNLVILDFLLRHGVIPADHPERALIAAGLRTN